MYNNNFLFCLIIIVMLLIYLNLHLFYKYNCLLAILNNLTEPILPYDGVVVGCARDIMKYLPTTKINLQMLKNLFKSCKIIVYENDSKDNTLDILKQWANEDFIQLITQKNIKGLRTERLAYARNILYKEAMKYDFDLFIVIDMDDVNTKITRASIESCFNVKEDWAMVGANQTGQYYDMWALLTFDDWMPFDPWYCVNIEHKCKKYCLDDRMKIIPYKSDMIQVKSCFGGFGIYKRQYMDNCSYGTGLQPIGDNNNTTEACEHIIFNKCITNNGGKIYINPQLINS